jgi:FtsP/CotA-like multicopper oxidase with cupredoxin domain
MFNLYSGLDRGNEDIDDGVNLRLPSGSAKDWGNLDYDVNLMLADKAFDREGQLYFDIFNFDGFLGDVMTTNLAYNPYFEVERRKYRFRILASAVSRSWKLSLDSGESMAVIATDGGLMPVPQWVKSFRTSSGERYEVIIDFARYPIGRRVILQNSSPKNNRNYENTNKVMAFDVVNDAIATTNNSVPDVLDAEREVMGLQESDSVATRRFEFKRQHGSWTINGTTWDDVVKSNYAFTLAKPRRGTVETWEFVNDSGGWFHPVHLHYTDFKILDRNGKPPLPHELGPKDVVYLGEGEKVRVLINWRGEGRYGLGRYMMHCHNIVHEDHDMMAQFEIVGASGEQEDDPRGTLARPLSDLPDDPL